MAAAVAEAIWPGPPSVQVALLDVAVAEHFEKYAEEQLLVQAVLLSSEREELPLAVSAWLDCLALCVMAAQHLQCTFTQSQKRK